MFLLARSLHRLGSHEHLDRLVEGVTNSRRMSSGAGGGKAEEANYVSTHLHHFLPRETANQLAPPAYVPERTSVTPGTTFLPGSFVFWVHNDEEVKEAEPGFSSTHFFRSHPDGT